MAGSKTTPEATCDIGVWIAESCDSTDCREASNANLRAAEIDSLCQPTIRNSAKLKPDEFIYINVLRGPLLYIILTRNPFPRISLLTGYSF